MIRIAKVEVFAEFCGKIHNYIAWGFEIKGLGLLRAKVSAIGGQLLQANSVPTERHLVLDPVDRAQRVQPKQGRSGAFILDIGQPAEPDEKFVISVLIGDPLTRLFDVTISQAQTFACLPQSFARFMHRYWESELVSVYSDTVSCQAESVLFSEQERRLADGSKEDGRKFAAIAALSVKLGRVMLEVKT